MWLSAFEQHWRSQHTPVGLSTCTATRCSLANTFLVHITLILIMESVLFQWRFTERGFFSEAIIDGQQEREEINEHRNYSQSCK